MRFRLFFIVAIAWLTAIVPAWAQFKQDESDGTKIGAASTTRWRYGMIIKASGGACRGLNGYAPIPTDWPEQQVTTVNEEVSPEAKIQYETVDGGVRIMKVRIGQLPAGQEAKALVTVEIRRNAILAPENTDIYKLPELKKLPQNIRRYLTHSPKIESRDPKIRELAKTVGADKEKAWDHVEAIYDFVREKIKYQNGPLRSAVAALKEGVGDCEEMTGLFIAICRAAEIPARTVWVPGHCYPEFYLIDDKGQGHWFPCQIAGSREFGGINELRPILQKGDNFRPARNSKERQRYMTESLTGTPMPGGGQPQVRFVRESVPK
jgi:hypothetical protein